MRYINLDNFIVHDQWSTRASEATQQLLQIQSHRERSRYIKRKRKLWSSLKRKMAELSNNKCWYCETKHTRNDLHVDHFRPKLKVKEYNNPKNEHQGYWWLAFEYTNYRLSCSYCNSRHRCSDNIVRGKGNFFPLVSGSNRCNFGDDIGNERPELLDPLNPLDQLLLWFYPDGRVKPSHPETINDGINKKRAETTIDLLNLNHYLIREQRRLLNFTCESLVREGNAIVNAHQAAKDNNNEPLIEETRQVFNIIAKKIIDSVIESAPLSRAAKIYLSKFEYPWLKTILAAT